MSASAISRFPCGSVSDVAISGTQKSIYITDETMQNQLSEQASNTSSTALINPKKTRKFKDNSLTISYELFYRALQENLGVYKSSATGMFPNPILSLIAGYVDEIIPSFNFLSDLKLLSLEFVSSIGFGKQMWNDYFGDIGAAPPLPNDICAILKSPCPFFPGKTVEQTHMLVLVPETLNGKPMTLKRLGDLMQGLNLKQGKTGYDFKWCDFLNFAETPFEKSHWVLMINRLPEETRNQSYAIQKEFIGRYGNYQIPKIAQAAVAIFMEYATTGIRHYSREPSSLTRCQEAGVTGQMAVGGFTSKGLIVCENQNNFDYQFYGVAALRTFS